MHPRFPRTLGCAAMLALAMTCDEAAAAARKAKAPRRPAVDTAKLQRLVEQQSRQLADQQRLLQEQQTQLAAQRETTDRLQQRLAAVQQQLAPLPPAAMPKPPAPVVQAQPSPAAPPQVQPPPPTAATAKPPAATESAKPPAVAIAEAPGVLTPRGKLVLEPSLQYAYSSNNRVALIGYTIIPAITIGLIDIRSVSRNTLTAAVTARYGLTNRMEVEAKVPYVYRRDSTLSRPINIGSARDTLFEASGRGIGDIEVAGRYQLNNGGNDKPYYVAGLRLKTRTGKDPFEVPLQVVPGVPGASFEEELPTGSGFWGIQPALTVIYPSDPAVFFGTVNYLWNIKRNINAAIGEVDPGDAFGFSFGMGLALNEKSSFSIGYDHSVVGKTKQNGAVTLNAQTTQLGTLLLGYSYRLNPKTTLNLSLGAGLTKDAPDVQLTLRVPYTF